MIKNKPWEGNIDPFRLWGNLYFAGGLSASVHIVDTGEGLIVFDIGYQESLYLIIDSIYRLGFQPSMIRYLMLTHGHIDHCGAAAALREMTGCRIFLGAPDLDAVTGANDLTYATEFGMNFVHFTPDVLLNDGDTVRLGNTEVTCIATPGHTAGAMSFFFNVWDGKRGLRAGLHGGMGINTMSSEYLIAHDLPFSCRDDFVAAMKRIKEERVDIFLGNHAEHNHTLIKAKQLAQGNTDVFVDSSEWSPYVEWCIDNLNRMIEKENSVDMTHKSAI